MEICARKALEDKMLSALRSAIRGVKIGRKNLTGEDSRTDTYQTTSYPVTRDITSSSCDSDPDYGRPVSSASLLDPIDS